MTVVEFNYGSLQGVINATKSMSSGYGQYESYKLAIKSRLKNTINEGRLPRSEPKGRPNISNAQGKIDQKSNNLDDRKTQWTNLANNLVNFLDFIKAQDEAVKSGFELLSQSYTNYSGVGGFFTRIGDSLYSFFGVSFTNSNSFTRAIGDWAKNTSSDVGHWVKQNVIDWFKHGEGKYYANMVKSALLTGAAVAGTVAAVVAAIPSGGLTLPAAVAGIGAIAGIGATSISAFNSYHSIKSNYNALSYDSDPGRARLYGDVSSYSDRVKTSIFNSHEEYNKKVKIGKGLDVTEGVLGLVSLASGVTTTLFTKEVPTALGKSEKVFDFSGKTLKTNFLKQFGLNVNKERTSVKLAGSEYQLLVNPNSNLDDISAYAMNYSDDIAINTTSVEKIHNFVQNPNIENIPTYTKRTMTFDNFKATSDYSTAVASNGIMTESFTEYAAQADRVTTSIDYSNAFMTNKKLSDIQYLEDLNNVDKNRTGVKLKRYMSNTSNVLNTSATGLDLLSSNDKNTGLTIAKDIAKKNKAVSAFDKYVYSVPTNEDTDTKDYLGGVGGSNRKSIEDSWKKIRGKE